MSFQGFSGTVLFVLRKKQHIKHIKQNAQNFN